MEFKRVEIILHIPHAGTYIPESCRDLFYPEVDLEKELFRMTDWYTDRIFDLPFEKIVFPYSRLVCDVERFRNDADEVMAARGMGVCYEKTSDLMPLKRVAEKHRREMLHLYDEHHRRLTEAVRRNLDTFGKCLIIDCHSFAARRLPYEDESTMIRPDICIGTDPFHTPKELEEQLVASFQRKGFSVAVNSPFTGTIVPMEYYGRESSVMSVMIEVNRGLYLK